MRNTSYPVIVGAALLVFVLGGMALAAQDRSKLKVPQGLSFSDIRGYEDWQTVAVSQTEDSVKVISANRPMINAYRVGIPGNGKLFPSGSKIVKIEWAAVKNTASPYFVRVPGALKSVSFIEKDLKKFPKTHGWAYAQFKYDPATKSLAPSVTGTECGFACHSKVANLDYTYTAYPAR